MDPGVLFDTSPLPTWILDAETFAFLAVNRAAVDHYGYSEEEFLGMTIRDVCVPEDLPLFVEQISSLPFSFERHAILRHRKKDGTLLFVEPARQATDLNGRRAVFSMFNDVTDRIRAEDALRESEERFHATFDLAAVGIAHVDMDGRWLRVNGRFCEISGYTEAELRALRFQEITHPDDLEADLAKTAELVAGRTESFSMEKRYIGKDGSPVWINMTVSLVRGTEGKPMYFIAVVEDIAERKRAEAEIAALNERLQRTMTETHHRVKNNLQVISSLVDMQVGAGKESVPTSELVRMGQHIRALATIHDLLTQQTKEAGEAENLSVRITLDKLFPILEGMTKGRHLRFQIQDARLPIRQATSLAVLVNELVSNATKHGQGEIGLSFIVVGDHGRLVVCDEGPGFPSGFDPRMSANTGIELIESVGRWDLRGEIEYTNRPEGGACVAVRFPLG
jgi:PAS domain S-box-containing protein